MNNNGTNIVNKIDYKKLVNEFLTFFYSSWKDKNINITKIINEHTRFLHQKNIYKGEDVIRLLFSTNQNTINFEIVHTDALEDGSRKIQIMVLGFVEQNGIKYRLAQDFTLTFQNDWKIQNSILNIFI